MSGILWKNNVIPFTSRLISYWMTNYTFLLPPSEGKQSGWVEQPYLWEINSPQEQLIHDLTHTLSIASQSDREAFFWVKWLNCDRAYGYLKNIYSNPTLPVIQRYSGIMFTAIDYPSLTHEQQTRFNNSCFFMSGLFWLIRPNDRIPEYKCPIGAKLGHMHVTKYWKDYFNNHSPKRIIKNEFILNLLPQAHQKIFPTKLLRETIAIKFVHKTNTWYKQAWHLIKQLKGPFVQYVLLHENISYEILKTYRDDHYQYCESLSDRQTIVYEKK